MLNFEAINMFSGRNFNIYDPYCILGTTMFEDKGSSDNLDNSIDGEFLTDGGSQGQPREKKREIL